MVAAVMVSIRRPIEGGALALAAESKRVDVEGVRIRGRTMRGKERWRFAVVTL